MSGKKMKLSSGLVFLVLLTFLVTVITPRAFAANGDGSGSKGVYKPLALTSVTLADGTQVRGADNIPLKPKFTFLFDKNVVYLLYWERNVSCFHLYDEDNKELAVRVTKIDDTVDFTKRQYIWVEPVDTLTPGTNFRIFISPDLLAKNGVSTLASSTNNQGVTINFKTTGEKPADNSGAITAAGDSQAVPAGTKSLDKPAAANQSPLTTTDNNPPSPAEAASSSKAGSGSNSISPSPSASPSDLSPPPQSSLQTSPPTSTPASSSISEEAAANQTSGTGSGNGNGPDSSPVPDDQRKTAADVSQQADSAQAAQPAESSRRKVADYVAALGVAAIIVWLILEYWQRKTRKK